MHATPWINPENIILSGRSQSQKITYYDFSYMFRIEKSIEKKSRLVVIY